MKNHSDTITKGKALANAFINKMGGKITVAKIFLIGLTIVAIISIAMYIRQQLNKLKDNNLNMEAEYKKGSSIASITGKQGRFSHDLRDYYIMSSYNSCCGGDFKNDYVDLEPLKEVIKAGARVLDFEIYSMDNKAVVAASDNDSFDIKGTYNQLPIDSVIDTIGRYAFSNGFCNNAEDPLLLNFRVKTDNTNIYKSMTSSIVKHLGDKLLGTAYGREGRDGKGNITRLPLLDLKNKVIIMVDNASNNFRGTEFEDLVNLSSGTPFLRYYRNYNVVYTHDTQEIIDYNRKNMTLSMPDYSAKNKNCPSDLHHTYGVQMCCMCLSNNDGKLESYLDNFNKQGTAFILKPKNLRFVPLTIKKPPPQDPKLSYAKRKIDIPVYQGNI